MYKYLFGPVPSRRLGMSLGVDLVPHKVCSFNCVYCECGKTTIHTIERKEYVPVGEVFRELLDYFNHNTTPDYITFSGSGEPTLNSRIGEVLAFVKKNWPGIPVAVLTNGSLLNDKEVRKEILAADVVLPSLDAATERTFRKINRPFHGFDLDKYIQGLIDFRAEYKGKMWLEVFILPGYNDNTEDLSALKNAILKIQPDIVQLNTLDRPGAIKGIAAATRKDLEQIASEWNLDNIQIIAASPAKLNSEAYRSDYENAILETLSRRPCTADDLASILDLHTVEVQKYLGVLENNNKISFSKQERGIFYRLK